MKTIIIESITKPTNPKKSIKYEGQWHPLSQTITYQHATLQWKGTYQIEENEKGEVTSISPVEGASPTPQTSSALSTGFIDRGQEIRKAQAVNLAFERAGKDWELAKVFDLAFEIYEMLNAFVKGEPLHKSEEEVVKE